MHDATLKKHIIPFLESYLITVYTYIPISHNFQHSMRLKQRR